MLDVPQPRKSLAPIVLRALRRMTSPLVRTALVRRATRAARRAIAIRDFVRPSEALVAAGRFDDADALIERGLATFPGDPALLLEYARVAQMGRRISVAVERYGHAIRAAPDRVGCHTGLAATLRVQGDVDRALDLMTSAERAFPDDPTVLAEAGRLAQARGEFERALAYWRKICTRTDADPEWLRNNAYVLVVLKRFEEAEALLDDGLFRCRDSTDLEGVKRLFAVRGTLASAREDWGAAVAFWRDFQTLYPNDPIGWQNLGRALHGLASSQTDTELSAPTRSSAPEQQAKIDVIGDDETRTLLLGFESLGESCEFGLVQRRYAAEPLSLLRWNTVSIDRLIEALMVRLDRLGDPDTTELIIAVNGEYFIRDRRWGFEMHTWLFVGQVEPDDLLVKMRRRIVFLKDKLLADLASGEKTCVVHAEHLDERRLDRLHRVLRTFGPVRLLAVQTVQAPTVFLGAAGDVVRVDEDRFLGFIRRLGLCEDGSWNIAFDDWLAVCEKTIAFAAGRPSASALLSERDATETST